MGIVTELLSGSKSEELWRSTKSTRTTGQEIQTLLAFLFILDTAAWKTAPGRITTDSVSETYTHSKFQRIAMVQAGVSPAGSKVNVMNGHSPMKKNGANDSSRSNGKKRLRETENEDVNMEETAGNTSQRKPRQSTPASTPKTSKTVYMRDENDLDANDDDELAHVSNGSQGKLKKRKSGLGVMDQDRKFEAEKRKEKAKRLAEETATLPVNTGKTLTVCLSAIALLISCIRLSQLKISL